MHRMALLRGDINFNLSADDQGNQIIINLGRECPPLPRPPIDKVPSFFNIVQVGSFHGNL